MSEFVEFSMPEKCQSCPELCAINGLMRRFEQELKDRIIEGAKLVGEAGKEFDSFIDRSHPCSTDELKADIRRSQAVKIQLAEDRFIGYRERAEQLISDCPGLISEVPADDPRAFILNHCQSPQSAIDVDEFDDIITNLENSDPPEYY